MTIMVIGKLNCTINKSNITFNGIRQDLKTLEELKTGTNPLLENKKINIQNALDRLAVESKKAEIEAMMEIAENIKYGTVSNSEMSEAVNEDFTQIDASEQSLWSEKLKETISHAISRQEDKELQSQLEEKFKEVFGKKQPLSEEQQAILDLRKGILEQINGYIEADDETISDIATVKKLLDYFIISPDISEEQKQICLDKMKYFLSDEYRINPQLKDKKIRALQEILNDMVIKTPESEELLIKDVDQRQSGICAAISVCRKALAYEDKVRYMEIVLNELDDSDYMTLYDITNLGEPDKKVKTKKPYIDYTDALRKNYRILDASAHIWMQIAGTAGKGDINLEKYIAFDREHYSIFRDSKWYPDLGEEYEQLHSVLNYLIKTREYIKDIKKLQKTRDKYSETLKSEQNKQIQQAGKFKNELISKLTNIISPDNAKNINKTANDLIEFSTGKTDDGILNLHEKMPVEYREEKILNYIKSQLDSPSEKEIKDLKDNIKDIRILLEGYERCDNILKEISNASSAQSDYKYNKNLFLLAASHRLGIEAELDNESYLSQYEKQYHLPPRQVQIKQALSNKYNEIPENKNTIKDKVDILRDINAITSSIPNSMEEILKNLVEKDLTDILVSFLDDLANNIKDYDKFGTKMFAEQNNLHHSKASIIKAIELQKQQIIDNPTFERQQEAIRLLGYDNIVDLTENIYQGYIKAISTYGINEAELKRLESIYGENIETVFQTISKTIKDSKKIIKETEEKYQIPTSKEKILKRMEKDGFVLSRKTLDYLEEKFDKIYDGIVENEKNQNSEDRKINNNKLFASFTSADKEVFNSIQSHLSDIIHSTNKAYTEINKELQKELNKQYADVGKMQGHFWVAEDGFSGLYTNQTLRILELMTGKPYYIESDIHNAENLIRKGNNSGITSTSVDDKAYAMHAQYVTSITDEQLNTPPADSKHSAQEPVSILWHDNSWGRAEKDNSWFVNNTRYTDYGRNFGWKSGYIVRKNLTTGTSIDDMNSATGYSKKYKEKFPLFVDMILPGDSPELPVYMAEIFNNVFDLRGIENNINLLEKNIKSGFKINTKKMQDLDKRAFKEAQKLRKKIKEEIKTEDDYNALDDNDPIKINLEKLVIYKAIPSKLCKTDLYSVLTRKQLNNAKKKIFDEQFELVHTMFGKTPDSYDEAIACCVDKSDEILKEINAAVKTPISQEDLSNMFDNIMLFDDENLIPDGSVESLKNTGIEQSKRVSEEKFGDKSEAKKVAKIFEKYINNAIENEVKFKSLDNYLIKNSTIAQKVIKAIDKHYNPRNDEELLKILQKLQNANEKDYLKETKWLKIDDIIDMKPAWEYAKQIQSYNGQTEDDFDDMVTMSIITNETAHSTVNKNYRSLMVILSDLDLNRRIKRFQEEMFTKYRVRPAFSQLKVFADEDISKSANAMIDEFVKYLNDIGSCSELLNTYNLYCEIDDFMKESDAFSEENTDDNMPSTKKLSPKEKNHLLALFADLKNFSENSGYAGLANEPINIILNTLSSKSPNLKMIKKEFKLISDFFDELNTGEKDLTKRLKDNQKEILKGINTAKKNYIESNILPEQQNEISKQINHLIRIYKNGSTFEKEDAIKRLHDDIIKYHITQKPIELLNSYIKALQNPDTDPTTLDILKAYLRQACRIAQLSRVEFKLVEAANLGMSTKVRDIFDSYIIMKGNNGELLSSTDKDGLIYLTSLLADNNTNNSTLNLFLTQSGLNDDCVTALIEKYNTDSRLEVIKSYVQIIEQKSKYLSELIDKMNEFFENNTMQFPDYKSAMEQLTKYIKKQYKNSTDERKEYAKNFIKTMKESKVEENNFSQTLIIEFLHSACKEFINLSVLEIQGESNKLEDFKTLCDRDLNLISSISLNEEGEAGRLRKEFFEISIPDFYNKMSEIMFEYANEMQQYPNLDVSVLLKEE